MKNKEGTKLKCNKCGYEWNYKGEADFYTSCPKCRSLVKVK